MSEDVSSDLQQESFIVKPLLEDRPQEVCKFTTALSLGRGSKTMTADAMIQGGLTSAILYMEDFGKTIL